MEVHFRTLALALLLPLAACDNGPVIDLAPPFSWTKGVKLAPAEDALLPEHLREEYLKDALHLALRDMDRVATDPTTEMQVPAEIPGDLVDLYYRGLIHIYNATDLTARDTVVSLHPVHVHPLYSLRQLIISTDSTATWVEAWRHGEVFTSHPEVDALLAAYDLRLSQFYSLGRWPTISFETPRPMYVRAIAEQFESIEGVRWAKPNTFGGDGDTITASIRFADVEFAFTIGWGDCLLGCINERTWVFRVRADGSVAFIESFGDAYEES